MSAVFPARYPGHCSAECGQPIEPGDMVFFGYIDEQLVHADCADPRGTADYRRAAARHEAMAHQFRGDLTALGHVVLAREFRETADQLDRGGQS